MDQCEPESYQSNMSSLWICCEVIKSSSEISLTDYVERLWLKCHPVLMPCNAIIAPSSQEINNDLPEVLWYEGSWNSYSVPIITQANYFILYRHDCHMWWFVLYQSYTSLTTLLHVLYRMFRPSQVLRPKIKNKPKNINGWIQQARTQCLLHQHFSNENLKPPSPPPTPPQGKGLYVPKQMLRNEFYNFSGSYLKNEFLEGDISL